MFHILGADAVGMSTVPEVIRSKPLWHQSVWSIGYHRPRRGGKIVEVSHEEVQKAADEAQPRMTTIMREMINRI